MQIMNILLTSVGRRSYLIKYFKAVLKRKGQVHASNSVFTIALQEADEFFISPLIYSKNYIEVLVNYCLKKKIKAIISVFDIDLLVLSKAKQYIESKDIKLLLSEEYVVKICNDKWETYQFLKENDLNAPKTFKDIKLVLKAIEEKELEYPIIIKPRWGMASRAIYIAENEEELIVFYNKSLDQVQNSYLKYESDLTPNEPILFQEFLKGQEYGLDIINDLGGNFVCVLPKSKLQMRAGETDLGRTTSPLKFERIAKKLSDLLKHEVIISVDCFVVDGEINILEINCRISGHYPLSHLAGTDLPKQIIEWLEGNPTNMDNFKFEEGVYFTKDLHPVIINFPQH